MSRQEAREQYLEAQKLGQKEYKNCILQGKYPYLQVLDEILFDPMVAGRVNLGLLEIPTEQIVGTKSAGRVEAFAANFMPLLPEKSEFATKWITLCEAHLSAEGIRDPIRCYEYLGRFYVQEGNKRVSVLKSYGAATIPAYVTRLVPVWTDDPQVRAYYEFLDTYRMTGLYRVYFTRPGSFSKLQAALGFEPDHVWTEEDRRRFLSGFTYFRDAFRKLGGDALPVTAADALVVWLKVYPFDQLRTSTPAELQKTLGSVWADVQVLGETDPIAVNTAPVETEEDKGLLGRLVSAMFPAHLTVAFINQLDPETSPWTRAHLQGAREMQEALGNQVTTLIYNNVGIEEQAEHAMEEAVKAGAQVLFTTTAPLISACRKIAVRYPNVRVLNCSVSMPYTGVRTYYSRIYEGKFISGAIAGAMSKNDVLGFVGSYPIFGVPAGINAFALGAQLTNPRARVKLLWSCVPGDPMEELARQGIECISTLDITSPDQFQGKRGVCQLQADGQVRLLASPYWNWGAFYIRLVRSILNGGWEVLNSDKGCQQAVNYWWGMDSDVVGIKLSPDLPEGIRVLAEILRKGLADGSISPFHREIRSQDGTLRNDGARWLTPEEILHMDWLCDTVDGSIPAFDELLARSQGMVRLQGVYRDQIPADKEGVLL